MAKNVVNEKGFKVIALTPMECAHIGFGYNHGGTHELICDNCNEPINHHNEVYYIPVLNRVFCKDCFVDWYETAVYYPEDKRYEDDKYENILHMIEHYELSLGSVNYKTICHG